MLHPANLPPGDSVLGATAFLAVVGTRYPLDVLPLLFLAFVWKFIWVLAFGLDPNASLGGRTR